MEVWTTKRDEFAKFLLMRELDSAGIRQRIRQARKAIGMTQQDLADVLQVHKRTIENYENVRVPPWKEFEALASALDVSVGWLLHGDEATEPNAAAVVERLAVLEEAQERVEELLRELLRRLPEAPADSESHE